MATAPVCTIVRVPVTAAAPSPTTSQPVARRAGTAGSVTPGPGARPSLRERWVSLRAVAALAAVVAGSVLGLAGADHAADAVWAASVALMLVPLTWTVAARLVRGDIGVDVIALVSMAGALALGEYLAGAVIALMLAGGDALEAAAGRRARRDLGALLDRAPRIAHRRTGDRIEEVPVAALAPGDVVVVRAGDIVPADGDVAEGVAIVDESALTGEALPVSRPAGAAVRSGSVAAGEAFELVVTRDAPSSAYGQIVEMVQSARADRAPFVRMADRYAVAFLAVTVALAGIAWLTSGDAVRALAVFVVATPCPLILAAPVAIVAGLSRAAGHGIVVKDGAALEQLGRARSVLLDKTGTVTGGLPVLLAAEPDGDLEPDELLRVAASADQLSAHALAEAIVHAAEERGLTLSRPSEVVERGGQGLAGTVDGRRVTVGSAAWLRECGIEPEAREPDAGTARVLVGIDGRFAGALVLGDRVRPDAGSLAADLHDAGVRRVVMATGDREDVAAQVAAALAIDEVHAELDPAGKVGVLRGLEADERARPVVMVGDGVNDAPALALADVGVAMAGMGDTVSSQTADVVILVDRIDRLPLALRIGRRSLTIARQSVLAGMGLSIAAMIVAAAGGLVPVAGALLQEAIDVAVILNALRARHG
jgi:heavy metal translocating P-type ATPase